MNYLVSYRLSSELHIQYNLDIAKGIFSGLMDSFPTASANYFLNIRSGDVHRAIAGIIIVLLTYSITTTTMRSGIVMRMLVMLLFAWTTTTAQDSSQIEAVIAIPDKLFDALDSKAASLEAKLNADVDRHLTRLSRQEEKLKRKLWKKDSVLANELFGDIERRFVAIKTGSNTAITSSPVYSRRLDSLTTALKLLQKQPNAPRAEQLLSRYISLQSKLDATERIKKQVQERQAYLKEQFEQLGMVKELRQFRKQVYYYQAQVREYKAFLDDPSKWEAKLLELAMKLPQFREFFARNSALASLFAVPGNPQAAPCFVGLQTRASIDQSLINRFGSGTNATAMMQQNLQSAQSQLETLKRKASSFTSGSYGNGDPDMPDFKPNAQKTKSLLKRLEYGVNVQSQKARYFFPVTSDIGLSLGYKLNDKSVIGIGLSYKLGWGKGWDHIAITHQGIGIRSYVDWQLRGAFYISGGYEQNYRSLIHSISQLKAYSGWQQSGLVGLSKRYKAGKVKGEMKLLWDFLSYQQVPRTQPVVFRIGYQLK